MKGIIECAVRIYNSCRGQDQWNRKIGYDKCTFQYGFFEKIGIRGLILKPTILSFSILVKLSLILNLFMCKTREY